MYEEFVKPTLLVGLFAPPEELSAAAVIECLYFYGEVLAKPLVLAASRPSLLQLYPKLRHPACWSTLQMGLGSASIESLMFAAYLCSLLTSVAVCSHRLCCFAALALHSLCSKALCACMLCTCRLLLQHEHKYTSCLCSLGSPVPAARH